VRALLLLGLISSGCVHSHTKHVAHLVGDDGVAGHLSASGWYARDTEVEDGVETTKASYLATVNAGVDYGIAKGVDAGADLGLSGIGLRFKVGAGAPGGPAFAIVPAVAFDFKNSFADLTAVGSFGPVSVVGFFGGHGQIPFGEPHRIYGGGVGYRKGRIRAGFEVQRWGDPEHITFAMFDLGYALDARR
jgi:hypothetical protein